MAEAVMIGNAPLQIRHLHFVSESTKRDCFPTETVPSACRQTLDTGNEEAPSDEGAVSEAD